MPSTQQGPAPPQGPGGSGAPSIGDSAGLKDKLARLKAKALTPEQRQRKEWVDRRNRAIQERG